VGREARVGLPGDERRATVPPSRAAARESSRRPPRCFSGPWQPMQLRVRIGSTWLLKSTFPSAGAAPRGPARELRLPAPGPARPRRPRPWRGASSGHTEDQDSFSHDRPSDQGSAAPAAGNTVIIEVPGRPATLIGRGSSRGPAISRALEMDAGVSAAEARGFLRPEQRPYILSNCPSTSLAPEAHPPGQVLQRQEHFPVQLREKPQVKRIVQDSEPGSGRSVPSAEA